MLSHRPSVGSMQAQRVSQTGVFYTLTDVEHITQQKDGDGDGSIMV
jgi:hypothetical protein